MTSIRSIRRRLYNRSCLLSDSTARPAPPPAGSVRELTHLWEGLMCVCVCQFEVKMEDCLIRGDASGLVSVLHHEGLSNITLSRLDQLVTKVRAGCLPGCHGFMV